MSGLNTMSQVLTKGIEAAAGNDKAAGGAGNLSALGGMLNQGDKAASDAKSQAPSNGGSAAKA